ncbi:MAG: MaoC family dehydratase [Myxococcota bacterium]
MSGSELTLSQLKVGTELPELAIDITTSLVVGGAIASRDFTPVHHDKKAAQAAGMPDVFMNILTTNGLVSRYITDWAGPDAVIRNVSIRLGTPNTPGETMTMRGKVVELSDETATVEVAGANSWGDHVTGTVKLALPR